MRPLLIFCAFHGNLFAQAGMISVKDHGAKGAGGDDTAAILDAVKASAADPNHPGIFFPPGTYKLTKSIALPSEVTILKGAGHNSTRIVAAGKKAFWMIAFEEPFHNEGAQVQDLYLDCANVAAAGLVLGVGAHSFVANNIIARCTDAALILDAAQNSTVLGNDLRESAVAEKIVNGAGNCVFIRNEHELTSGTIQFVGEDQRYPSWKEKIFDGSPTQNVFGPGNIYADGGTYTTAVHVQRGAANLWFANNLTSGDGTKVLIQLDRGAEVNTFADNQIQMGSSDAPVIVNDGYLNGFRGGGIQVRAAPNQPCTKAVINNSSMAIDRVRSNDNCFFSTLSGTGVASTYITALMNGDSAFPKVFESNGNPMANSHLVRGSIVLNGNAASTVNLAGGAVFTSKSSYSCQASGPHQETIENISGNQFTIGGSPGDSINYLCVGQ